MSLELASSQVSALGLSSSRWWAPVLRASVLSRTQQHCSRRAGEPFKIPQRQNDPELAFRVYS